MTTRRTTLALAFVLALTAFIPARPVSARLATAPDGQAAGGAGAVFTVVDALATLARLGEADIVRITGVALAEAKDGNRFFKIYRGTAASGPIAGVELRVAQPGAAASAKDMVILTIAGSLSISEPELNRRFGKIIDVDVPPPTAPPTAPEYSRYRVGQRVVSFGLSRTAPVRVVSIVLDLALR